MTSLAGVFNVPTDPEEFFTWTGTHAEHHREISRRLQAITGIPQAEFILDPVDPNNMGTFLQQHQDLHNTMNTLLGNQTVFDLSEADINDPGKWGSWIDLNATEHRAIALALGID